MLDYIFVKNSVVDHLSLCSFNQLLPLHQYSVDIFSYSGPSDILGSDGKQNTT